MSLTIDQNGNDVNSVPQLQDAEVVALLEASLNLDPVIEGKDGPVVRAVVIYNPLDYTDRTVCDLVWAEGKTLAQYLDGLPEADWSVSVGARLVERADWGVTVLSPLDTIVVGVVANSKILPILMVVAMVALVALGPAGWGAITALTFTVASVALAVGGFILMSVLADSPKQQEAASNKSSQSYGLDGAKNTSLETQAIPVVYGEFRIAGNKTNLYVQNNPDKLTQTLFTQYVIGEGEIESVSDVLVNDQPLENFQAVQFAWRSGTQNQPPMQWFSETISPRNVQAKVSEKHYVYETLTEVDRVRVDFAFSNGLYSLNSKTGTVDDASIALRAGFARIFDDGSYDVLRPFESGVIWNKIDASASVTSNPVSGLRLTVEVLGNDYEPETPYSLGVEYTVSGEESNWRSFGSESGVVQNTQRIDSDGIVVYSGSSSLRVFEVTFPENVAYFRVNGCVVVGVEAFYAKSLTYTDNTRGAIRHSVTTPPLERGRYRFEFWRDDPESTDSKLVNGIVVTDINEIKDDLINYGNTAYYAVQVSIGSDINQEPNITALVKGKKVKIYDRNGNVSEYRWSDNPADIALDVMLNPRHRFSFNTTRIDFAAFDTWRAFCQQNKLFFNGTFDAITNVWDGLLGIMRIGRGSPILQGLKWSVLIEGPADPVMMFTQDNMVKGSFTSRWTGRKGRANLIEVQYYDKTDNYKQHSVFALDDSFIDQGEALVQSTIQLRGITDALQATKEATLQLNLNRYLTQSVDFDVYLQAMGCVVGDVILCQHDMPAWGYSGRIIDAKTFNKVTIDSDVPFNGESNWRLLLVRGTAMLCQGTVTAVSGKQLQIGGLTQAHLSVWNTALAAYAGEDASILNPVPLGSSAVSDVIQSSGVDRIMINGYDYRVVDWALNAGELIIVSDEVFRPDAQSAPAQVFKNDVMCEANLAPPSFNQRELTITGWNTLYGAPRDGDIVMLGQVNKFKKPFRILKISYKDDHVRTISALEYNDSVYGDNAHPTPNYSALPSVPYQVDNLRGKQVAIQLQGGAIKYQAHFDWDRPLNDPRGYAGSKVYGSVNFSPFTLFADAANPIQSFDVEAQIGDTVRVKVVAYSRGSEAANYDSAPIAAVQIGTLSQKPAGVTGFVATGGIRQIALRWEPIRDDFIMDYEVWENDANDLAAAYLYYRGKQNYFVRAGLNPKETRFYWVRSVAITEQPGDFTGPVSATSSELIADDIQNGILETAKFADSISPVGVYDGVPQTLDDTGGAKVAINTQDGKLYRWNGIRFTTLIDLVDVPGVASQADVQAINRALTSTYLTEEQTKDLVAAAAYDLTDEQIERIKAATVSGLLPDARLNASNIVGQLTADQLQSIDFSKVTGSLSVDRIFDVDPVTGEVISGIDAGKLVGTLNADVLPQGIPTSKLAGNILDGSDATLNLASPGVMGVLSAAHVAALNTLNGRITSTQISDNAVRAPMIEAGAVNAKLVNAYALQAENIAAAAITAEKLAVGSSNNAIANSCFYLSGEGWTPSRMTISPVIGSADEAQYGLTGLGATKLQTSVLGANEYGDCYWTNGVSGTGRAYDSSVPCQPGETWEAQIAFFPVMGAVECFLLFVNASGGILASPSTGQQAYAPAGSAQSLANWRTIAARGTAPANTVAVGLIVRVHNTTANAAAVSAYVSRALLGRTTPNATQAMPWTPGGVVSISGGVIRSNAIVTRHMVAGAVKAETLDAGAVTAEKLAIGNSSNAITNSCFAVSTNDWSIFVSSGSTAALSSCANRFTSYATSDGAGVVEFNLANGYVDAIYKAISCLPGETLEVQAMLLPVGARASLYIEYLNNANGVVGYSAAFSNVVAPQPAPTTAQQGTLTPFSLASLIDRVPASATAARLRIRSETSQSLASGYTFITRVGFGRTYVNAKQVSPWMPGGVTSINGGVIATESIVARNLAVGSVAAEKVQTASASNVIGNPTLQASSWGWRLVGNASNMVLGSVIADGVAPKQFALAGEGSGCLRASAMTTSQVLLASWSPDNALGVPCGAGEWWEMQSLLVAHRCCAQVYIEFYDAAGALLQAVSGNRVVKAGDATQVSNYAFSWTKGQAPAGTAWVLGYVKASNDNGADIQQGTPGDTPYCFFTRVSLGRSNPLSIAQGAQPQPYQVGGTTQIVGGQIVTDAIQARHVSADSITSRSIAAGEVKALNIGAGAITTEKLAVGSANNVIWNSCALTNNSGWVAGGSVGNAVFVPVAGTTYEANWLETTFGTGLLTTATPAVPLTSSQYADLSWNPNSRKGALGVPAEEGQCWRWQARVITPDCTAQLFIQFFNASGSVIGGGSSEIVQARPLDGKSLSQYGKLFARAIAPANTKWVYATLRAGYLAAASKGPALLVTQTSLGLSNPNAVGMDQWAPGGVTQINGGMIETGTIRAGQLDVDDVQARVVTATNIKAKLVGADQIDANNIAANSISSSKIGANQILARNIAAGAVTTEKLTVGSATNMIWNSSFELGADNWVFRSPQPFTSRGAVIDFPTLSPNWALLGSGTGLMNVANLNVGEVMDASWIPDGSGIPVQPGQWFVGQAQVITHRCAAQVLIVWVRGDGSTISASISEAKSWAQPPDGRSLNNYNLMWISGQAPPNAIYAQLTVRAFNSGSGFGTGGNPFLFFSQVGFGQTWSSVTEPPPYAAGGVTKLSGGALQTNSIAARHVAAGAITTEKLSVGSGNVIWNSVCMNGLDGWAFNGVAGLEQYSSFLIGGTAQGIIGNGGRTLGGFGTGCVVFNTQTPVPQGQGFVCNWYPGGYMPVLGGRRYQAAALLQPHRINGRVDIVFLDANGQYAGEINGNIVPDLSANKSAVIEYEYQRSAVVGSAPSNAASAYMRWIAYPGSGGSINPYMFFSKAMLSEAPPNATQVGEWQPGGVTEITGGVIRSDTVQARHMRANSISADSLQANSVVFGKVAAGAIRAAQIRAGEIRTDHLAADFALISTAQIGDAIITNAKIGNLEVSGNKIGPGAATGAQYSRNTYRGTPQTWVTYAAVATKFDQFATGALIVINCQNDYQGEQTNVYIAPDRGEGNGSSGGQG